MTFLYEKNVQPEHNQSLCKARATISIAVSAQYLGRVSKSTHIPLLNIHILLLSEGKKLFCSNLFYVVLEVRSMRRTENNKRLTCEKTFPKPDQPTDQPTDRASYYM